MLQKPVHRATNQPVIYPLQNSDPIGLRQLFKYNISRPRVLSNAPDQPMSCSKTG